MSFSKIRWINLLVFSNFTLISCTLFPFGKGCSNTNSIQRNSCHLNHNIRLSGGAFVNNRNNNGNNNSNSNNNTNGTKTPSGPSVTKSSASRSTITRSRTRTIHTQSQESISGDNEFDVKDESSIFTFPSIISTLPWRHKRRRKKNNDSDNNMEQKEEEVNSQQRYGHGHGKFNKQLRAFIPMDSYLGPTSTTAAVIRNTSSATNQSRRRNYLQFFNSDAPSSSSIAVNNKSTGRGQSIHALSLLQRKHSKFLQNVAMFMNQNDGCCTSTSNDHVSTPQQHEADDKEKLSVAQQQQQQQQQGQQQTIIDKCLSAQETSTSTSTSDVSIEEKETSKKEDEKTENTSIDINTSSSSSNQRKLTHLIQNNRDNNNNNDSNGVNNTTTAVTVLHTYHYPPANITLYGLSISISKFKAWVAYMLENDYTTISDVDVDEHEHEHVKNGVDVIKSPQYSNSNSKEIYQYISTENISIDPEIRNELRREWFTRRLISDRTEVLASYPSNSNTVNDKNQQKGSSMSSNKNDISSSSSSSSSQGINNQAEETRNKKVKRGGFDDLLAVYSDRLVGILKDELDDITSIRTSTRSRKLTTTPNTTGENRNDKNNKDERSQSKSQPSSPSSSSSKASDFHLISWLQSKYGINETNQLMYSNFSKLNEEEQFNTLKHFLNWFREHFPYYYDRCDDCDASFRDDSNNNNNDEEISEDNADDSDDDNFEKIEGTFLGYIYPNPDEIEGKASRTELYHCHKCRSYTRFPRFNLISSIVKYGRGRCGEYSILVYRLLRDLGHNTRWVVDWSDHVWVECWMGGELGVDEGRWVHLDPCEAACDEPFLYQQWGKKQTLIMAFWVPQQHEIHGSFLQRKDLPLIEDVTHKYTTESMDVILGRREEPNDNVQVSIQETQTKLRETLSSLLATAL